MKWKMCLSSALLIFLVVTETIVPAWASEFRLSEGTEKQVCRHVVDALKKSKDLIPAGPEAFIGRWNWMKGSFYWTSPSVDGNQPALFAYYDVDNDGEQETVLRQSWMLGSHENIALFIFRKKDKDFTTHPRLTADELRNAPQIASGTDWPYSKYGLYYLLTAPLVHEGVSYLVIMDELFGRKGHPDRNLIVAKYAGVPISSTNRTDKLTVVCKIESSKPFIP